MKNIFAILLGLIIVTGFVACNDNDDNPTPLNPNTSFIVVLDADNWQRESNARLKYDIPLQDLDDYYMDQGGVAVALSFDGEASYDILPTTFSGIAYSVNYTTGWITVYMEDPLADEEFRVDPPENDLVAKIILTTTDYLDYQGIFNNPEIPFKRLN